MRRVAVYVFVKLKWIDVSYALVSMECVLIKQISTLTEKRGENPFKNLISIYNLLDKWHVHITDKASVYGCEKLSFYSN